MNNRFTWYLCVSYITRRENIKFGKGWGRGRGRQEREGGNIFKMGLFDKYNSIFNKIGFIYFEGFFKFQVLLDY